MRPSEEEALALHRKYGSHEATIRHCKTVAKVSMILAEELKRRGKKVDSGAILAGALLHDIGRTRTQTVRHGVEGSEILKDEGVDQDVLLIVRRHVGAGISPEEAKALGFPDLGYVPRTTEEAVVCFADKMVDADRVRPFEEEVKRFVRKGHDVPRLLALRERVRSELGQDPEALIFDKIKASG
ncbi:MAG: HDIG domain-containing protein [Thaumarchaeota archaeon]|nr:HDIG domain-containing protein [Nitrososphaerota archaeon]